MHARMNERSTRKSVTFCRAFHLAGIERSLPAGSYEVITDEQLIDGLSFPVYRRVATMMLVPGASRQSSMELLRVDPADLVVALARDALPLPATPTQPKAP